MKKILVWFVISTCFCWNTVNSSDDCTIESFSDGTLGLFKNQCNFQDGVELFELVKYDDNFPGLWDGVGYYGSVPKTARSKSSCMLSDPFPVAKEDEIVITAYLESENKCFVFIMTTDDPGTTVDIITIETKNDWTTVRKEININGEIIVQIACQYSNDVNKIIALDFIGVGPNCNNSGEDTTTEESTSESTTEESTSEITTEESTSESTTTDESTPESTTTEDSTSETKSTTKDVSNTISPPVITDESNIWKTISMIAIAIAVASIICLIILIVYLIRFNRIINQMIEETDVSTQSTITLPRLKMESMETSEFGDTIINISGRS